MRVTQINRDGQGKEETKYTELDKDGNVTKHEHYVKDRDGNLTPVVEQENCADCAASRDDAGCVDDPETEAERRALQEREAEERVRFIRGVLSRDFDGQPSHGARVWDSQPEPQP